MTLALSDDRQAVRELVEGIKPVDEREAADCADVLAWIAGGAELYRRVPPAVPPKHLVTYFLPYHVGTDMVFLVEHRKAGRWLPPGVHLASGGVENALSTSVLGRDRLAGGSATVCSLRLRRSQRSSPFLGRVSYRGRRSPAG